MLWILLFIALLALIFGPQLWVRQVLQQYQVQRYSIPGTGAELVEHLLRKFNLPGVKLEETQHGDHYDPVARCVRLSAENMRGKSLTAVATAAHEVGHAIQHAEGMTLLLARQPLAVFALWMQRIAQIALISTPFLLTLLPIVGRISLILIFIGIGSAALVHLVTLPVEIDASFKKALPILKEGQYIDEEDYKAVRKILTACALTYVAGALASALNVLRWVRR
ncbi:MAG: zinc metallopeptidase [Oceanospirillaceae bacterium]|nr:zinc metallopeptidase [Oceanospirillaceae bacterium]